MGLIPNRGRARNAQVTDPSTPLEEYGVLRTTHRQLSLTFHPMTTSTLVTLTQQDWQGHRRWDRRRGTLVLGIGQDRLRGLELAECYRLLLREALEHLS